MAGRAELLLPPMVTVPVLVLFVRMRKAQSLAGVARASPSKSTPAPLMTGLPVVWATAPEVRVRVATFAMAALTTLKA